MHRRGRGWIRKDCIEAAPPPSLLRSSAETPSPARGEGKIPIRWRMRPDWVVARIALHPAHGLELLHPAAPVGLGHVDIALGIDGEGVAVGEVADLMAGAAEARENLAAGVVENMHLLGAAVHHIHVLL